MLRKLLKYDLKSVGRFWWIIMIVMVILFGMIGVSARFLTEAFTQPSGSDAEAFFGILAGLSYLPAYFEILCVSVCVIAVEVLIYVRYFKHFFTDEGYLTFTLPVSRKTHLLSKIITYVFWMYLTGIVVFIGFCGIVIIAIPFGSYPSVITNAINTLSYIPFTQILWFALWMIIGIPINIASLVCVCCFTFFCITFGATIVKRGKIFASIGIYIGMTTLLGWAGQTVSVFAALFLSEGLATIMMNAGDFEINLLITAIMLLVLAVISTAAAFTYSLTRIILERKLNLA